MRNVGRTLNFAESFSRLYPSEIVEACGGVEKFCELKTVNCSHLSRLYGEIDEETVTDPIMIGFNSNKKPFIVLTFDVYNAEGKKIAEKVSEVFHNNPCVYEWDYDAETWQRIMKERTLGVETWQRICRIDDKLDSEYGIFASQIAEKIHMLLNGHSVKESGYFIELWKKDLQTN